MGFGFLVLLSPGVTLFSKMVTVFGVVAPALMIPVLAGFVSRHVTSRGALAGVIAGLISGISFYLYRLYFLPSASFEDKQWATQVYEPMMIFVNVGVTIVALVVTSLLERRAQAEEARVESFFLSLSRPVSEDPVEPAGETAVSPFHLVGVVVMLVGALLALVGLFMVSGSGRSLDLGLGLGIVVLGYLLYRSSRISGESRGSRERV
jgi:hypothetical protein